MADPMDKVFGKSWKQRFGFWLPDVGEEAEPVKKTDKPKVRGTTYRITKDEPRIANPDLSRRRRRENKHKRMVQAVVRRRLDHGRQHPVSHKRQRSHSRQLHDPRLNI